MRTLFTRFDLVTIGAIRYQPVTQDHDGAQFMRLDGSGTTERFRWDQIESFRASGDWRYERNAFGLGTAPDVLKPGLSRLATISPESRNRVLFHHNVCTVVDELRSTGKLSLTYSSIDENRSEIEQIVYAREIGRNASGQSLRGGDRLAVRKLPCAKTILKKFRKYRLASGNSDAIVPRYHASNRHWSSGNARAEELLAECVLSFAHPDQPTKAIVVSNTARRFGEENERREQEGMPALRTFSRRTIERRIDRLDKFFVAVHRNGLDAARKAFASYGSGLPKLFPMERIEIDEWTVDLISYFRTLGVTRALPAWVRNALPRGRRTICVAIDVATRCVVGLILCKNPSAMEAIRLLRMVVQDKTDIAREIGAESPWPFHGGLGVVATDAGSAFQSDEFQAAVHALHGRLEFPPLRVPELRGPIERLFGTVAYSLMPRLSGRTFSDVVEKGDYDAEARAVLDDGDLLQILLKWVIDVYHNTPHGGLKGQTPAARWRELTEERFVTEPPDRHTRRTALGLEVTRSVSARGVLLFANHYSCPAIQHHSNCSRGQRVSVRVDPDDIGAISIRIGNDWHPAPAVEDGLDGVSLNAWRTAFTKLIQQNRDQAEMSHQVRDRALRDIDALVDRRVSLLLPDHLNPTQKQIDHLDRHHFHGRSFAPAPESEPLKGVRRPFGTQILPARALKPAVTEIKRRAKDSSQSSATPISTWRIEDE